ncbi:DNA cytosine methyltransferase [Metabacillus rhizolycopersici]|uniref:DNA (cytosine-5-)-methyltransferase n=1 Tax=Metabacillus rhizolycopersici TaxID=2875709 RepID=A0ABS7UW29_9BACI|nr:DNA (cytosine-5-)-methyltransferase [Metabacillus rhizolycopersici]MBZ5752449.1 DNA (cytosine-5-)-methyltransferase [Metabacillus rhizolycopersici]
MVIAEREKRTFVSSLTFTPEEVQNVLFEKILEENELVQTNITEQDSLEEKEMIKKLHFAEGETNIVSLFSGAGGLDLGVELSSMVVQFGEEKAYRAFENKEEYLKLRSKVKCNFVYSNDMFTSANMTYVNNFAPTVTKVAKDIRKVAEFPSCNLMLGGFPCPGFSSSGPRLLDDPRNFLYVHYIRALVQSTPEFFVAENVKGLMTMARGQVLSQMIEDFKAAGYYVTAHLVNSRDYGVPQLRERVFIVGIRNDIREKYGFEYEVPEPTHGEGKLPYVTLKDTISDLPLDAKDVYEGSFSSMYMSRNRKKNWDEQSFTIQASGRQAPMHPHGEPMKKNGKDFWEFQGNFNRRLSVREVARIQSFPNWFEFSNGNKENVTNNHKLNEQYKQIGNAVPVLLAEKMVRPIIKFLYEKII